MRPDFYQREKIIVNPKESKTDREATITTVTTIPAEGVNVEARQNSRFL